jgi:hypothetical protein
MNGEHAEVWIPVAGALARVEVYERERRPILGIELAHMEPDENVLLPAFADFSGCGEEESWACARRLLTDELPAEATHATFVG